MKQYRCIFRTYDSTGDLKYENTSFTFRSKDAGDYMQRVEKRYASHGMKVEFESIKEV